MFKNCQALEKLNLRSFRTPKVTTMESMFQNCYNMQKLNIYYFDLSSILKNANGVMTGIVNMLSHLSRDYASDGLIYATETLHGQLGTVIVEGDINTTVSGLEYANAYFNYSDPINF